MANTAARTPLEVVKNGAQPSAVPDTLRKAIGSLGPELLRKELLFLCQSFPDVIPPLEHHLLVQGKDVVRYHADTDSEDEGEETESETESESDVSDESGSDRESKTSKTSKTRKLIAIGDDEYTARMATCQNCDQEFDVTFNHRGFCLWHPGIVDLSFDHSKLLIIQQG